MATFGKLAAATRPSMRPRPGGRGEHQRPSSTSIRWFKCFNAATTRRPWRSRTCSPDVGARRPALQCGHDPEAVESWSACPASSGGFRRSSMRPRPGGRGERPTAAQASPRLPSASMRPRPGGRGEVGSRGDGRAALAVLQCGHDPEAVESATCEGGREGEAGGFNAATTRRPWRTACAMPGPHRAGPLQCGHDPEAVESRRRFRRRPTSNALLQCGHDPEAVESVTDRGRRVAAAPCFNAATTRRPWRVHAQAGLRREQERASMRPRPGGRGEAAQVRASKIGRWLLQCGHDPEAVESGRGFNGRRATEDRASMRPRPGGRGEPFDFACEPVLAVYSFNAATTRRPWRSAETVSRRNSRNWQLQCGHDPEAVERTMRTIAERAEAIRASMRPRPGGRGEASACQPQQPNRTSALQCGHDPEAVEKLAGGSRRATQLDSFNAATTRRPWRAPKRSRRAAEKRLASMRPRPGGRGEVTTAQLVTVRVGNASMRPRPGGRGEAAARAHGRRRCACFNAATTRRPWRAQRTASGRASRATVELQCGHDPEAVESRTAVRHWRQSYSAASMRPRPGGRGETRHLHRADATSRQASMRPRPGGRGEVAWSSWRLEFHWALQCGHDPEAVERRWASRCGCRRGPLLQCGHDPEAVERRCHALPRTIEVGHASMRPRPGGRGEPTRTRPTVAPAELQCGHDPEAVESSS